MSQKKILTRTLSGILVGGMLLTFGGFALASNDKSTETKGLPGNFAHFGKFIKNKKVMHKAGLRGGLGQETLNLLVKEGTITQAKADEIKAYLDKKNEARKAQFKRPDLFSELVDNKILTQTQVDSIKAKLQETMKEKQQQLVSDKLKALVEKGTITQEQANKILIKLEAFQKERAALFEKTKDMTPQERQQFMKDNKGEFKNPLTELVKDGTITQKQAEAFGKAMFKHKGHMGGRR